MSHVFLWYLSKTKKRKSKWRFHPIIQEPNPEKKKKNDPRRKMKKKKDKGKNERAKGNHPPGTA
jgi:hypothetical protein